MKLKEAIEKFEKGRTSPDDYYDVYYLKPNEIPGLRYTRVSGEEIDALGDIEVIEYKPFEGGVMNLSLDCRRLSHSRKCRAVSIKLEAERADTELKRFWEIEIEKRLKIYEAEKRAS